MAAFLGFLLGLVWEINGGTWGRSLLQILLLLRTRSDSISSAPNLLLSFCRALEESGSQGPRLCHVWKDQEHSARDWKLSVGTNRPGSSNRSFPPKGDVDKCAGIP